MAFTLQIHMTNSEGVLERILGRLRQRNFGITSINADCSTDMSTMVANITVNGLNPQSAMKQLDKLHDVQYVQVNEPTEKIVSLTDKISGISSEREREISRVSV